jgi:hypothetical protein
MKITRNQLRRIIKEELSRVLIEDKNPGSHFAAAETKGKETSEKEIKAKWSKRIQKTYDWFMGEVFPAMKAGKKYITSPDHRLVYQIAVYGMLEERPSDDMQITTINPNTRISLKDNAEFTVQIWGHSAKRHAVTLRDVWSNLESTGADPGLDLDVQMTSDAGEDLDSD